MRAKLRSAIAGAGVLALVILGLLIATAVTGSPVLAGITAVVGVLGVVGAGLVVHTAIDRLVRRGDRTSTRISQLDKRAALLDERILGLDERAAGFAADASERREALAASNSGSRPRGSRTSRNIWGRSSRTPRRWLATRGR